MGSTTAIFAVVYGFFPPLPVADEDRIVSVFRTDAAAGIAAGALAAALATHLLAALLYDVEPSDPMAFAWAVVVLLVVAMSASYLPARRAMRVDPVVALRAE